MTVIREPRESFARKLLEIGVDARGCSSTYADMTRMTLVGLLICLALAMVEPALLKDNPPEDDIEIFYQRGSVLHPAHEMYPMCHHCPKNSTYEECTHKRTLKRCDNGLSNICFTKSTKGDNKVHYNMGCANHKQCQRARAKPCKAHEKRCFTCCQWSGCNSIAHHDDTITLSSWNTGHITKLGWSTFGISLVTLILVYLL